MPAAKHPQRRDGEDPPAPSRRALFLAGPQSTPRSARRHDPSLLSSISSARSRRIGAARVAFVALLVGAFAAGAGGDEPVPWPKGAPPSGAELDELVIGAVELAERERMEEFLEAAEKGEDREHIVVFQEDIDQGLYDLDRIFAFGDALFEHEFRGEDGYGAGPTPSLQRVHVGVRGGLDTFSCAGCHFVGGPDGAGAETQNAFVGGDGDRLSTANVRNPPPVIGLGLVQALAAEMSSRLALLRDGALKQAAEAGAPARVTLVAKDVSFGALTAHPDGTVDTTEVVGVDPDLVVRPFGWKGSVARLRRFVEDAARIHFGVQSHVLALGYGKQPDPELLGPGPDWWDPDADGVQRELEEGALTAGAVYLAMLETPVILPPRDPGLLERWARGSELFDEVGCADCHKRELLLEYALWTEAPDTTGGPGVVLNLLSDGEGPRGTALVKLFSDLKRHDMGPELADPHDDPGGVPRSWFLTRPLWGLAETAPYLHDGRAQTIPAAIVAHGGEAQASRDAFLALEPDEQRDLHVFLLSLTREPKARVAR